MKPRQSIWQRRALLSDGRARVSLHGCAGQRVGHVPGRVELDREHFHHTARMAGNLKLMNCLLLEFPIAYFRTAVDLG